MVLRINDGPYVKGDFEDNFMPPAEGNTYPVFIHQQKEVGNNYEVVESGRIGIRPESEAEKCVNRLIFGCGRIDIIYSQKQCVVCFRDAKVLVSSYLEIGDCKLSKVIAY